MSSEGRVCDTCKSAIDGYELCPVCWQGIIAVGEVFDIEDELDSLSNLYWEEAVSEVSDIEDELDSLSNLYWEEGEERADGA